MDRSPFPWRNFILGATAGLIIGALVTGMILGRYTIMEAGPYGAVTVRLDRLTGQLDSWKLWQGKWQRVEIVDPQPEKRRSRFQFVDEPCPKGQVWVQGRCLKDDIGIFKDQ